MEFLRAQNTVFLAILPNPITSQKLKFFSHFFILFPIFFISRVDTISYTESILLGDPLDFLGNWPPFKWVINLPSLALMRCLFQNKTALHCLHRVSSKL